MAYFLEFLVKGLSLYPPGGGGKGGRLTYYRNVMVVFLVSGLWHGAGLTFIVWGGIHGFYQIVEHLLTIPWEKAKKRFQIDTTLFSWRVLAAFRTFLLVDFAWIFFRVETITKALEILKRTVQLKNIGLILNGGLFQLGLGERDIMFLSVGCAVLFVASWLREKGIHVLEWVSKQNIIFRYALYWGALVMIIFSLDLSGQEFIYFQF